MVHFSRHIFNPGLKWSVLNPVFSRSSNLESNLIDFFAYLLANSQFLESSTVHFPCFLSFLLAVASKNVFIINLAKMWFGRTPDVVVGTLKVTTSFFPFLQRRNLASAVMLCNCE